MTNDKKRQLETDTIQLFTDIRVQITSNWLDCHSTD